VRLGIFIGSLFVLVIGLLIGGAENNAHGQTSGIAIEWVKCVTHYDAYIAIIDQKCKEYIQAITNYASQGYEIKGISNSSIFLQKVK